MEIFEEFRWEFLKNKGNRRKFLCKSTWNLWRNSEDFFFKIPRKILGDFRKKFMKNSGGNFWIIWKGMYGELWKNFLETLTSFELSCWINTKGFMKKTLEWNSWRILEQVLWFEIHHSWKIPKEIPGELKRYFLKNLEWNFGRNPNILFV